MTKEQRAACLRAAAIRYLAINDETWERMSALERGMYIADMGRAMDGFFPAAAALPNPHKLVERSIAKEMASALIKAADWDAAAVAKSAGLDELDAMVMWAAAHDAAPEWDGVG